MKEKQEKELYEFLGQDKLMITTKKQRISNIHSMTFHLDNYFNEKQYYHTLYDKVEKKLENEKDILRAKQYKNTEYYYYSTQCSSRLAKKIVQRMDKKVQHLYPLTLSRSRRCKCPDWDSYYNSIKRNKKYICYHNQ